MMQHTAMSHETPKKAQILRLFCFLVGVRVRV
jgi:hypothetical protein